MDPGNSSHGGDVVETLSDPSGAAFPAVAAAAAQEMAPVELYLEGNVAEGANVESSAAAAQSPFVFSLGCDSYSGEFFHATNNNARNLLIYDIPWEDVAGDGETMASGQLGSDHPSGMESDWTNYEPSQGTLPQDIGDRGGTQSSSGANLEIEEPESDSGVPKVGMEFDSEGAAFNFCKRYAKQTGFNIKKGKIEYVGSNKEKIRWKNFSCSYKSKKGIDMLTQGIIRACEAKIKCTVEDGKWKISKAILRHSHSLKGCLAGGQEGVEDLPATRGNNVNELLIRNDVWRGTVKNPQELIDYFCSMQVKDPSFFSTLQLKAGGMVNFIWRDNRSRVDYEHFGDVLVLDTRTRINNDMICAVFWGLNHHRQRIIFGWAILVDQTMSSFNWLLQSFFQVMGSKKLKTIITEIREEIAEALTMVLPGISHCLSYWSIYQTSVGKLLHECVSHVQSPEEFESKWNALIEKHNLHENAQVASLYGMRHKWSHAFTKNVFSAGLLSIQNNEDARLVFKIPSREMTLTQIACHCEKVAELMRMEEFQEDKHCEGNTANMKFLSPMDREAHCSYTRSIYKIFQKELIDVLSLKIEESTGTGTSTGTLREFKLTKIDSTNVDIVRFNSTNSTVACSCGKFESVGILCFHALKALNSLNIFEIPSSHFLKRWMKSAKNSDNPV